MNIIESNGTFSLANFTAQHNTLPVGNYLLKFNERSGYYLVNKPDFELPKKVYGDNSVVKRWLKSYENNSEKNMGIILSGIKGSGKTITAQKFCIEAKKPVIIINEAFDGSDFIDFLTSFNDVIIFIDEYEKIYKEYNSSVNSTDLLSLMDGNYQTKIIFLLTVNEFSINSYLINRLNRIKYRKHYEALEESVVEAIIEDMLINKDHKDSIYQVFKKVNLCTFDLLINLIKEMNLFNEDGLTCASYLNLESSDQKYDVYETIDGKEVYQTVINLNGITEEFFIYRDIAKKDSQNNEIYSIKVILADCVISRSKPGSIIITNEKQDFAFTLVEQKKYQLAF